MRAKSEQARFWNFFSRIYVINLASRTDRRDEMSTELDQIGKSFGDKDVHLFPAVRPEAAGPFASIGARGCFMSHLGVLADAEARGDGPIAILEDDVAFAADFAVRAPRLFDELGRKEWAVFYGGHRSFSHDGDGLVLIPSDAAMLTTHFVCFNRQVIAPLRRYLEAILTRPAGDPNGGPMHVDGAYNWFRKHNPALNTYAAAPALARQRSSRSDVAPLRWFDRTPVAREAAAFARRLMSRARGHDS